MVREPDATVQPSLQDDQLMSEHRILRFKPQLRLEWRGQDGQSETEQRDHRTNLADSVTRKLRIRFSVHTTLYPSLAAAFLARRRIDFAVGLRWLLYHGKAGAI